MDVYLVKHEKDDETVISGWNNHGLMPVDIEQINNFAAEIVATSMNVDYYTPVIYKLKSSQFPFASPITNW